ncbi:hypothetical protein PSU4_34400 [Pseudonocardia sulfidoxydans NBRC 16205]|uniref:HTH cro/C1-type domain-containing protein n=1 Tax=Pseudonocardia sulfidoxydans NBRC 16205 TaxID=1223511 RepID=A0A511DI56_9PSEU|nr:HigA family addiction module antitoxin [Pseudonocardia sulfidoxydans]GEL24486.1 hypothetical protein PSU4_34400 [Pseudonocardia sulfidoxydans NBRC 16205]
MTTTDKIAPIHPGEVLMEDFIEGFGITQNKLAVSIGVPPRRINEIVHGKRGITADTALRLARYFGTSAEFWINLQSRYELDRAEDIAGEQIASITPIAGRVNCLISTPCWSALPRSEVDWVLWVPRRLERSRQSSSTS